jgi:iron(III) transport system substrate-binding protein
MSNRTAGVFSILVVIALLLAACAPVQAPAAGGEAAPAAAGAPGESGNVVLYAVHGPELVEPILEQFSAQYPDIQVDIVYGSGTGEIISRVQAEAANPLGDVMWGGATEWYEANAGLFAPIELENDAATLVQDPNHVWHAADLLFQTIAVNTDLLTPEEYPSTFQELADPKWAEKGGIALANPRASGTGYSLVTTMVELYGWDFVREMMANAIITEGSTPMINMVKDGEVPVAFINEDIGAKWMAEGVPIQIIYPTDGVSNQVGAAALIKGGPNPEPSATLLNFILSQDAQQILSEVVQRRPARTDVSPVEGLAPADTLQLVRPDPIWLANDKETILNEFDAIRQELGK